MCNYSMNVIFNRWKKLLLAVVQAGSRFGLKSFKEAMYSLEILNANAATLTNIRIGKSLKIS